MSTFGAFVFRLNTRLNHKGVDDEEIIKYCFIVSSMGQKTKRIGPTI